LDISGKLKIDYILSNIYFIGDIEYKKQILDLNIQSDLKYIDFYIYSKKLDNIKIIDDFVKLDKSVKTWIYDNVKGQHRLNYLTGKYDIKKNKLIANSLEVSLDIDKATVKFKDSLKKIITKKIIVEYKNEIINLKAINAKYNQLNLKNLSLQITNITNNDDPMLYLNLTSKDILGKDILDILDGYNIKLPLKQESGELDTNVSIDMNLKTSKLDINGKFLIKNAIFNLGKLKLNISDANILLNNNILDIKAKKLNLFKDILEVNDINLQLDTTKKEINGDLLVKSLDIHKDTLNIINLKNIKSDIKIDYKNNLNILLKQLNIKIDQQKDIVSVKINKLHPFIKNSDILEEYSINKGKLELLLGKDTKFIATITDHKSPLNVKTFKLIGLIDDDKVDIKSDDDRFKVLIANNKIKININNIDIIKNNLKLKENNNSNSNKKIEINAINTNILIDDKTVLSKKFTLNIHNNNIDFVSTYDDVKIVFNKNNKNIKFSIKNINTIFANSLFNNDNFMDGGLININGNSKKNNSDIIEGNIVMKDTNLKDLAILNNIISFIQSSSAMINPLLVLPSIYRLVSGDLTLNGYKILDGNIKFTYDKKKQVLNLFDIKTKGAELDFDGKTLFDFKNNKIDSNMKVKFMKDVSFVLSKIPLVNKIFLDDSETISTYIRVHGDMDNPVSEFVSPKKK
jgi:hypothetical protein